MPLRVVRRKRLSAGQRSKNKRAYRKRKSSLRRYARRYRKKASVRRRMKRISAFKKRRHLRKGQRLTMAGLERSGNMSENNNLPFEIDSDNYFDVAEALHAWLTLNHEGQSSKTYELLSRSEFTPGPLWTESRVEEENPFYPEINDDNVEEIFDALEKFMAKKDAEEDESAGKNKVVENSKLDSRSDEELYKMYDAMSNDELRDNLRASREMQKAMQVGRPSDFNESPLWLNAARQAKIIHKVMKDGGLSENGDRKVLRNKPIGYAGVDHIKLIQISPANFLISKATDHGLVDVYSADNLVKAEEMFHKLYNELKNPHLKEESAMDKEIQKLQESISQFSNALSSPADAHYAEAFKASARTAKKLQEAYAKLEKPAKVEDFNEWDLMSLPDMEFNPKTDYQLDESLEATLGLKKNIVESVVKIPVTEDDHVEKIVADLKLVEDQSTKLADMAAKGHLDEKEAKDFLSQAHKYLNEAIKMISEDEPMLRDAPVADGSAIPPIPAVAPVEEGDEEGGKAKIVAHIKQLEADLHKAMHEQGVEAPKGQDVPFKITGYDEKSTVKEKNGTFDYPEMVHFNVESWNTIKASMTSDGRIIREGTSLNGKGESKEAFIKEILKDVKDWSSHVGKMKAEKESGKKSKNESVSLTENSLGELEKSYKEKGLSPKEIEIAKMVTQGLSNEEIANQMFKKEQDIKDLTHEIYEKMGLKSRAQLIVWSLRNGGKELADKYADVIKKHESVTIATKGDVKNPAAVAAEIGRKKYGVERFEKMAADGKKHESISEETEVVSEKEFEGGFSVNMIVNGKHIHAEMTPNGRVWALLSGSEKMPTYGRSWEEETLAPREARKDIEAFKDYVEGLAKNLIKQGKADDSNFTNRKAEDNITGVNHPMEKVNEDDQSGEVYSHDNKFLVKNMTTKGSYELKDQSKAKALVGAMVNFKIDGEGKAEVTEAKLEKIPNLGDQRIKGDMVPFGELSKAQQDQVNRMFVHQTPVSSHVGHNKPIGNENYHYQVDKKGNVAGRRFLSKKGMHMGKLDNLKSMKKPNLPEHDGIGSVMPKANAENYKKLQGYDESMAEAKLHANAIKNAVDSIGKEILEGDLQDEAKKMINGQITIILKMVDEHEALDAFDKHSYLNAEVIDICVDQIEELAKECKASESIKKYCKEIQAAVKEHEKAMKKMDDEPDPTEPTDKPEGPVEPTEETVEGAVLENHPEAPPMTAKALRELIQSNPGHEKAKEVFEKMHKWYEENHDKITNGEDYAFVRELSKLEKLAKGMKHEEALQERAGSGLKETYPEWDEVVKELVTDAFQEVERKYELYAHDVEEIEHKSRDGFISSNDGGYRARGFVDTGALIGSGRQGSLPLKAQKAVDKDYELNCGYALDAFKKEYAEDIKDIPADKLNYHDLYEMGKSDLAEKLSELENEHNSDEQSTVMFEIICMFNAEDDGGTFTVQGVINWEAPYHRNKSQFEDFYEAEVEVKAGEDIRSKLEPEIKKAIEHMGV